ncbi:NAD(P)/FAD-dependent oxidoreductase [Crocosphaera sp. UHCC 0190]|uniref:NAD(P)/FAD-dependent oxidoreductase n=1 Tax=Crocosphaera sp. UHCC 0190 TaxID=3110246 RepID=UPI002B1F254D|nr:NAD(P)/FAD-dependent oxidoreductase [Crocosphaera sp. UHCC 0190]MEA5510523.1 NAD(P)/FAD-dependent oxidoreductase [Crocosphaera sp. UHCC 0190]
MNQSLTIIVIGGGAAGFFGAITCANTYPNTQVILLEAGRQPLAKVRISGGGRCNVTHHCFDPVQLINYYPRGSKALRGAFTRFQPRDTVAWFESQGVKLKTESDGRMFPITDNSETIVNCLINAALNAGVKLRTQTPVKSVKKIDNGFEIELKTGEILSGDRLLIATGSNPLGYRWATDLGHTIEPPIPSLFTFNINDPRLQGLAGVSVENAAVCLLNSGKKPLQQIGPVLITHWGLSGPAILKLSAFGARILHDNAYQMSLSINWVYPRNSEEIKQILLRSKSQFTRKLITNLCPLELPKRLWQKLINYSNINESKKWTELSQKEINQLTQELTQGQYKIKGKGVFKEEFVTCGGINLKEIDFKTMESKPCPNLYFAGEILDIDGVTGGFNFQSAWTTSWLAGKAIGKH